MSNHKDDQLPRDLEEVADALRHSGPSVSMSQLDEIKQDALGRASRRSGRRGLALRSKVLTLTLAGVFAVSGGTATVLALTSGGGNNPPNAGQGQYGKPCKSTPKKPCPIP